jgi:outer membrane lipopolysaccharide assembly protein LptE/RlpB
MSKKKITIFLFLFLSSCGYNAMYSEKSIINYDFSISKLTFIGTRDINIRLKTKLSKYTLVEKDKNFILEISSIDEKIIAAKDVAGDATSYKIIIKIKAKVILANNFVRNLEIVEDFTYDNIENQLDLKKYEREIKINLAETAVEKLIFKLSFIQ